MAIEYKVKVGNCELTIKEACEPEGDGQETNQQGASGLVVSSNALGSSFASADGGGANPKGGSGMGGGANPKGGSGMGGGANPKGGSGMGGGANPKGGSGMGGGGNLGAGAGVMAGGSLGSAGAGAGFQMEKQDESEWCWAAVSASVDQYFQPDSSLTQCEIVGKVLDVLDSCKHKAKYDQQASLQEALSVVHRLRKVTGRLTFEEVQAEIDAGRPVGVMIVWNDANGAAHFVAISGYQMLNSGIRTIDVADPFYPASTDDFDLFPATYHGGGAWTFTFLTKENKGDGNVSE